jgi:hypothetical protein
MVVWADENKELFMLENFNIVRIYIYIYITDDSSCCPDHTGLAENEGK